MHDAIVLLTTHTDTRRAYYAQNYSRNDLVTVVYVCANTPLATERSVREASDLASHLIHEGNALVCPPVCGLAYPAPP